MTALLYSALVAMAFGVLWGLSAFNRLVDLEFTEFPDRWAADGKPNGGRLSSAQASFWRSGFARHRVVHEWLVETPSWAKGHPKAKSLLARFRLGFAVMMAGVLTCIGVAILGT
jgi:hypothetical protein